MESIASLKSSKRRRRVLRIFWPSHCQDSAGWVIGWQGTDFLTIATVIADPNMSKPESKSPRKSPPFSSSSPDQSRISLPIAIDGSQPDETGEEIFEQPDGIVAPAELQQKVELLNQDFAKSYWRTEVKVLGIYDPNNTLSNGARKYGFGRSTSTKTPRPELKFIGGRSRAVPAQQVVLYNQPKHNEMYCDMFEWRKSKTQTGTKQSAFVQPTAAGNASNEAYVSSLHQLNTAKSVEWMLTAPKSPLSKELTQKAAIDAFWATSGPQLPILWAVARIQVAVLTSVLFFLTAVHALLNKKIPVFGYRLSEFGLLGGFLDKRLVILMNFRTSVERLRSLEYQWQKDPQVQRAWLRFYNTSLSLLFDSTLGLVASYLLWTILSPVGFSHPGLTSQMTTLYGYDWLKAHIEWILSGAPAGVKLNLATTQALGKVFLFYIEQWSVIVRYHQQWTPWVLMVFTATGAVMGLSLLIILVHDVIYFVNMHIYLLYAAITRVYHTQLLLLRSLWLLFRGKKDNILKQRIDTCNANLDQLVLGTLLFTSLIFLLPTTAIYYMFFIYAMCLVLLLQAVAQIVVNVVNYSPLYSLLLFLTRSPRLTGGVHFDLLDETTTIAISSSTSSLVQLGDLPAGQIGSRLVSHFFLRTSPVPLGILFSDFKKTLAVIASNYQLSKLIDCIVFGNTWVNKKFQPKAPVA